MAAKKKEPGTHLDQVFFVRVTEGFKKELERLLAEEKQRRPFDSITMTDFLRGIISDYVYKAQK